MRIQFFRSSCGSLADKLFAWLTGAPLYSRVKIAFSNGEWFGLNLATGELEFEMNPYPCGWDYLELPCHEQAVLRWCEENIELKPRKGFWFTRWFRYRRVGIEVVARALSVAGFEKVPLDPTALALFIWVREWNRDNPCPYSDNEIRRRNSEVIRW